jgi:oligopeptide transport system substrate-binding protein
MKLRRRQMLQAAAASGSVGLLSFLTACSRTPTASPAASPTSPPAQAIAPANPTAQTSAQPTPVPTIQVTATPTSLPQSSFTTGASPVAGALHLNLASEPDEMDPSRASFVGEIEVVMRVFSNLYTFNEKAQLVPDQAESLPQVSPDGKSIAVKLKKGLVWSDGKPLKAADFVYGAKRQLNPVLAGDYAFTLYALEGGQAYNTADPKKTSPADLQKLRDAVGVSAPDDQTIIYKLVAPAPWFLSVLATWNGLPIREDVVTAGGKTEDSRDWIKPGTYIGNGPYVLKTHDPGVQMVFESNPKYVRGEPPIKTVQYYMIKDVTVAFAAYQAGNLDAIGPQILPVSPLIKPSIDGDPTLKEQFQIVSGSSTFYLGFNTKLAPFDNVKVRQAFAAAFDRDTFARDVMKGLALPADQFMPTGFPGHYDDIPVQKFDPAAAKKLLADAGYPDGKGLPEIKASYADTDTNRLIMTAAAAMFQQNLGVKVTLDPIDPKAFSGLLKKQETTPQMYRLGWNQDYPDPQDWYSTVFQSTSTVSHTGWSNKQFDTLTEQADVEIDPKKRDQLYAQAAGILDTEAPVVFTHYAAAPLLLKPRVQGYKLDPFEYFFGQHSLYAMKLTM